MVLPRVSKREHSTIIAALRMWQDADAVARAKWAHITEDGGNAQLSQKEIDKLCETINEHTIEKQPMGNWLKKMRDKQRNESQSPL